MKRVLALAMLGGLVAGCAAKPFLLDGTESRAEVGFSGSPNTAETQAIAREHCARFERVPQFLDAQENVAYFDCVPP
jgi:hypothetical protein